MSTGQAAPPTTIARPAVRRAVPRRRVVAGWVAALVAAGVVGWWWSHPTALAGNGFDMGMRHWTVGKTFYAAVTSPRPGEQTGLRIHSASATATVGEIEQPGATTIAFYVCTHAPASDVQAMLMAGPTEIGQQCSSLVPAEGAAMSLGERPSQQLVMAVTPHRPGHVAIRDVTVTYSHRWQRGTEVLAGLVTLEVATP
ncbi:hypothetical protein [Intrasporangium flavum]|uniref:hypothetical protein n=1 Tax=Intrasporangium flavum TaxID=1428657 RepID=UPI00096E23D1|nr:hypothetical protein [Intrasporangium flavum]